MMRVWATAVLPTLKIRPKTIPFLRGSSKQRCRMTELVEVKGNMHMHTPYSDGEKWHAEIANAAIEAGLDYIIVTDHNIWVDGVEGYYENSDGRVLLLAGEEVHHVRREPQASHLLVYGANVSFPPVRRNRKS
ncbi:MAG: hypothetical protein HC804_07805 [Anaerolineae bacterium]|nr:hypothetical protein [Anaerolineae bacterium]